MTVLCSVMHCGTMKCIMIRDSIMQCIMIECVQFSEVKSNAG